MKKRISPKLRFFLAITLVLTFAIPQVSSAWSRASHQDIAADAIAGCSTFSAYLTTSLRNTLMNYLDAADDATEKAWVAHLDGDDSIAPAYNIDIWEKSSDPDAVNHCVGTVHKNMKDDPRMHNSIELLKLALTLKSSDPTTAMRCFANGMHLMQDYFAHENAPGIGDTGVSHGVDIMIDTNGNGVPDSYAGEVATDNLHWDNHSDSGNDLIPSSLRVTDEFNVSFWHYHANIADSWRYLAAYDTCIEYMQAYTSYETHTNYENALNRGYVINGSTTRYIDLLTRIIVDNVGSSTDKKVDAGATFSGTWETSTSVTGYFDENYSHDGTSGADSSSEWARFTPTIPTTGSYKIYMRWAASPNKADAAPVTIKYNGGSSTANTTVNQTAGGDQWNLLGTYNLAAGTGNYVQITATDAGYTEADAVMFIRVP